MPILVVNCKTFAEWEALLHYYEQKFPQHINRFAPNFWQTSQFAFEGDWNNNGTRSYYGNEEDWKKEVILKTHKIVSLVEFFEIYNENTQEKTNKTTSMEKLMLDVLEKTYNNRILRNKTVPLFMSNPGIGKTTIIKKFAEDKGVRMRKITLSQRMPNEVVGMVMPDINTGKLIVFDSHELDSLRDGDILFLDEVFNGTLKQTLDAVLNLLEDRTLPTGKKLADVLIVAASNPQGLINLTPQIKERFIRYDLEFNREEYQNLLKYKYGIPEFISIHLTNLINKEKFENNEWNYLTPRSIEKAIIQLGLELDSPYEDLILPILVQEIESPCDIHSINIKTGDKVKYLELLKLILKNDKTNQKSENKTTSNISD